MEMQQCPVCGSGATATASECKVCGARLAGAGPTAPPPSTPTASPAPAAMQPPPAAALDDFLIPGLEPEPISSAQPSVPAYLQPQAAPPQPHAAPAPPMQAAGPLAAPAPAPPGLGQPLAAPPNYMSGAPGGGMTSGGMGGGDVRVSLTGEVLEIPAPTPRQAGPAGSGPLPPGGKRPVPSGPNRPAGPRPLPPRSGGSYDEAPQSKGMPVGVVILLLLLLVGGGAGGYWWFINRTNPKDQAKLVYQSIMKQEWAKTADLIAWPGTMTKEGKDAFIKSAQDSYTRTSAALPPGVADALSKMEISTGEPVVNGAKADVPTSAKLSIAGREITLKGTAHMARQGGIWKLDMTEMKENDPASATKVTADLVGQPDMGGMGGPGMGGPGGMGVGGR